MEQYDLIVIGSGPAGEKGAAQAAYFQKRVALVEKQKVVGGACVNTGTIPSKTLREAALHLSGFKQREVFGVDVQFKRNVSIADLMTRKQQVVEKEWQLIEDNLRRHAIDRYRGTARFLSPNEIAVRAMDGSEKTLRANIILIATGSAPYRPGNIPFDGESIYDSDSILSLDCIPKSLAVIGAGVIGCEYASIFGALGTRVYLVDGRTTLLPHIDREIAKVLLESMETRLDMQMRLGDDVKSVSKTNGQVLLELSNGETITAEKVLVAAGRSSNTGELNLEAAGVATGKRGLIAVNEKYQTSVPNIFAAGDVIGFPALASTSMEQARVAMVHAFDLKYKTSVAQILPYAIYTIPELSSIGLTEEECVAKGIDYSVGRAYYGNNPRGQIIGDYQGMIKLVFGTDDLKLLGVHIVGENASELLHVGMMAMQFQTSINAFIDCTFNYPTLGDAYKYAAYDGLGNVARARVFKSEIPAS
jgi:Pyruvate/2-oxoglutarate dehydrogenase complex, dihydrolipoamide dehydrogenase (E3) component, and related enzymes